MSKSRQSPSSTPSSTETQPPRRSLIVELPIITLAASSVMVTIVPAINDLVRLGAGTLFLAIILILYLTDRKHFGNRDQPSATVALDPGETQDQKTLQPDFCGMVNWGRHDVFCDDIELVPDLMQAMNTHTIPAWTFSNQFIHAEDSFPV